MSTSNQANGVLNTGEIFLFYFILKGTFLSATVIDMFIRLKRREIKTRIESEYDENKIQ